MMEETKKLKMALYCRVSTHSQTTENQKLKLEDYAQRQDWDYKRFNPNQLCDGCKEILVDKQLERE